LPPLQGNIMKTVSTDVVVTTLQGKVRGNLVNGVNVFKGIPYAAPFGENRFRPPQPVEPWDDVRDALTYGPKPPMLPLSPGLDMLVLESCRTR
jgi:para-nitrobenzyl esterase